MKPKPRTEAMYSAFIQSVIDRWQPRLRLEHFVIYPEKDESTRYLACRYNYPYLDGAILWTDRSFRDWRDGDERHERKLVHELCHLITDPFYTRAGDRYVTKEVLEDERERLTDHIAVLAITLHGAPRP